MRPDSAHRDGGIRGETRKAGPIAARQEGKDLAKTKCSLADLQAIEKAQNRQENLWKSLEKTTWDLEKLGKTSAVGAPWHERARKAAPLGLHPIKLHRISSSPRKRGFRRHDVRRSLDPRFREDDQQRIDSV